MSQNPIAFLSYVRFVDLHENGRITEFWKRLSGEVQLQTGEEFSIFQDRNDIAWGQQWQERIPASDVKIAERVDNGLLTNPNVTEEWVRNALIFLPNHALLYIALAEFETDSSRADFLRSFGLTRLPKSGAICRRAGEMLLRQHQPRLALAAVDKALLADPTDRPTQRLRLEILDAMPER